MRFVLSAVAALATAAVVVYTQSTAQPQPQSDSEAAASQEIAKHQRVQPAIDLRSTVLLAVFMLPVLSLFKDGMGLIPNLYLILMVWVTLAGIGACVVSTWASWSLFRQSPGIGEEEQHLRRISRRKVIAFHFASSLLVVDFLIVAVGMTDALT